MEFEGISSRELRGFVLEEVELEGNVPAKNIRKRVNLIIEKQMLIRLIHFDAFRQGKRILEKRHIIREKIAGEKLFPEGAR